MCRRDYSYFAELVVMLQPKPASIRVTVLLRWLSILLLASAALCLADEGSAGYYKICYQS